MQTFLKVVAYGLAGVIACYFALALALTFWPASVFRSAPKLTPASWAAAQAASGVVSAQVYPFRERRFAMADGVQLYAREFDGAPGATTVLLLHGVAADSSDFNLTSGPIRQASGASVVALDLRGHGASGGRPWSIAYPGQYEDDVAQVVAALRQEQPNAKIVLAGHSMGGGIALRYALKQGAPAVDGYLLIAPLLGSTAPTMAAPPASPGAAKAAADFVYFHAPRFFGVLMLNIVGVTAFNDLPILYFNQPRAPAYGFRALQGMQPNPPKDYRAAFAAINKPLLLVAGRRDEAFNASAYPAIVAAYSHGRSVMIPDASHSGVTHDPRAIAAIGDWLRSI